MVEFIREPLQVPILDPRPEFSRIVPDIAESQTAYQILVSSSKEKLVRNEVDLWNSNKTFSPKSSEIEYAGGKLSDNSAYFWKVRIWTKKDKPSLYSDIQSFKTGILNGYATTRNKFLETFIKPILLIRTGTDYYFLDFGKDAFGTLMLDITPSCI